jgi:hypothetical protein
MCLSVSLPDGMTVVQELDIDDIKVVRGSKGENTPNDNVFGCKKDGVILWRVQTVPCNTNEKNAFTNIYINDNGDLIGYCWSGFHAKINHKDGTIVVPKGQRPW